MIRTPAVLTLLKAAGLDFARVDMEHSPNREWITGLLDAGVWNLHVPQIDTPEQAAAVAACCRYAPPGERGMYGFGPHTTRRGARSSAWTRSPRCRASTR